MAKTWSDAAVRNLTNWTACPRCDRQLTGGWCPNCGADLTGPVGIELAEASRAAVAALKDRQSVLERLPNSAGPQRAPVAAPAAVAPLPVMGPPVAPQPSSQVSVQSVLAVAGAGLVAVAAIVFTFFNEGLTDLTTRSVTVAIISLVFLAAAWLLARGGLQFSAEAVGALAMVFVVLDVWAISTGPHAGVGDFAVAAIATAVVSCLMVGLAGIRRLRTWLWSGLVGLAITPLLFGFAVGTAWSATVGWLGLGVAALLTHELARRLQTRFDSALLVDHATSTILQFGSVLAVLGLMFTLPATGDAQRVVNIAVALAALTALSLVATRNSLAPVWSYLGGAFATTAVAILPLTSGYPSDDWLVTVVPAAAAGTLAIVAALTRLHLGSVARTALLAGSISIVSAAVAPAGFIALAHLATVGSDEFEAPLVLAAVLAGAAVALALLVVTLALRNSVFGVITLSVTLVAVITMASWTGFPVAVRVALMLTVIVLLVALLRLHPAVRSAPRRLRAPLVIAAHALVVLTPLLTRSDPSLTVFGGIGVVVAIAALAVVMPKVAQPVYAAIAFAYALFVFAFTLDEFTVLSIIAVIGLTTVLAMLGALAVTLLRRISVPFWYAALTVAALPFLVSIGSMLFGISGWVGLSTGVSLLLFLALTVLHRDGLSQLLRSGAASLLLPGLAVVVISAGREIAERFDASASPVTLPIIAGLIAITLPCTTLIGRLLVRRGHSEEDATAVRLLLEISALVTGSVAVLLALLRAAAGFDTTFLVLVIVGLGAAATGLFVHRRYAWYVAFVSFTGALWALLALNTVTELEPYILPPALAAAAIGAVAVARGKNGLAFYATGLAVAVATPLLVLARSGNGAGTALELRAYGLLAGAVVLVAAGLLLERSAKLARLREATLCVGLGAASAGVVQAVRYGTGADVSIYGSTEAVMLPTLLFSLVATAIATVVGVLLVRNERIAASRWAFVPALVVLVLGPMTAWRNGSVYSWTLLILMAAVLAVMIVTVVLARSRPVSLPPVWVTFAIATATGIAGWSEHSVFRVEAYSIPLGLALLTVGIIAWRHAPDDDAFITRWPIGFQGSWPLLAPGIFVVLTVSIMSTMTDPRTERAILVIALALVAILLGNRLRLAAPFFLGIAALPLENLIVFGVQIGDKIEATTWWITLASAGAVLLVLAVSSERRASGEGGVAARLRDLR